MKIHTWSRSGWSTTVALGAILGSIWLGAVCVVPRNSGIWRTFGTHDGGLAQNAVPPQAPVSLFLRMTSKFIPEYRQLYLHSLRLFWVDGVYRQVIVLDDESAEDHAAAPDLEQELRSYNIDSTVALELPNEVYGGRGYDRQQWSMFWCDNYTTSEYVGFVDSDTVWVTKHDHDDLFEDGKPVVIGFVGSPEGEFWEKVPRSTEWFLKKPEVMRCMTYFPTIFRVQHLVELRSYIEKVHNTSFTEAFRALLHVGAHDFITWEVPRRGFSQFNIMCNYMWYFHRADYAFHFQDGEPGRTGTVQGQATDWSHLNNQTTMPVPRVSTHWGHVADQSDASLKTHLQEGYCYSVGMKDSRCSGYSDTAVQSPLFVFEVELGGTGWLWDSRCLDAQRSHYDRVRQLPETWNYTLVASVFS